MLDDTLPLTPPEWPEWGNPIEDGEAFATIRAYSPVDRVEAKAYPPMLVLAGLTDPRVTYWEAGEMGGAAPRGQDRRQSRSSCRLNMDAGPRRRLGPLRPSEGGRAGAGLRRDDDGSGVSAYPNVNTYASAPGSRKVISRVRSRTAPCSRTSW